MNKELRDAMKEAFEEISSLSDEEFFEKLNRHKDGDIAHILNNAKYLNPLHHKIQNEPWHSFLYSYKVNYTIDSEYKIYHDVIHNTSDIGFFSQEINFKSIAIDISNEYISKRELYKHDSFFVKINDFFANSERNEFDIHGEIEWALAA